MVAQRPELQAIPVPQSDEAVQTSPLTPAVLHVLAETLAPRHRSPVWHSEVAVHETPDAFSVDPPVVVVVEPPVVVVVDPPVVVVVVDPPVVVVVAAAEQKWVVVQVDPEGHPVLSLHLFRH